MTIWIENLTGDIGYVETEVINETKAMYVTPLGKYKKGAVYFREIDALNARIARSADTIEFYKSCLTSEEKRIKRLFEHKRKLS